MGRRRSMRRVARRRTAPEMYQCPACNHISMMIDMKRKEEKAVISCVECGLKEKVQLYKGEEEIDVYTRFNDAYYERS